MGDSETGQISEDAAKIYEEVYLPALFEEWCPLVVAVANIQKGHRVIDVACGTGALAITVSEHIGPEGITVGIDTKARLPSQCRHLLLQRVNSMTHTKESPTNPGRFNVDLSVDSGEVKVFIEPRTRNHENPKCVKK
jgi:hypothetical protein